MVSSSTLALLFFLFSDYLIVSRAAAPEGRCPVEYRGYFVRPYVHPSVCPSVRTLPCFQGVGMGALASGTWPGGPGLKALALGPWSGGPSLGALPTRPWPRGPGLWALACGPWPVGPGLECLAWRPWPGGPGLGA